MHKRYLSIILMVIMLVAGSVVAQSERISLYDFAAPYVQLKPRFVGEGNPPRLKHETIIAMELEIDTAGAVTKVSMDPSAHERMAVYIGSHVKQIQFVPAMFQGQKVLSILPIEVLLWPGDRWPIFTFPVDSLGQLNNRYLYNRCLELNEIRPPRVVRFDSYFATPYMDTISGPYRYALYAVDLDSSGVVLERRTLVSTSPGFDAQVKTAILWGEFAPAIQKGRSIPSTMYLLVSFFATTAYPTPVWPPNPDSVSNRLEFLRIQSFTDQSGLMALPVPQRLPSNTYPLGAKPVLHRDTVSVRLQIDSLGRCRFGGSEKTRNEISKALRRVVPKIKFSPAIDFKGRPQNYSGRALFEFTGEANVRVRWTWLR